MRGKDVGICVMGREGRVGKVRFLTLFWYVIRSLLEIGTAVVIGNHGDGALAWRACQCGRIIESIARCLVSCSCLLRTARHMMVSLTPSRSTLSSLSHSLAVVISLLAHDQRRAYLRVLVDLLLRQRLAIVQFAPSVRLLDLQMLHVEMREPVQEIPYVTDRLVAVRDGEEVLAPDLIGDLEVERHV